MSVLPVPKNSEEISVQWLNEALGQSGATRGATVTAFERELVGEGAGFIGELSRLTLTYDRREPSAPRSIISKLPTTDEMARNLASLFGFYEREIRFYQEVAGQIGLRTPACYYSGMDQAAGAYVLLLEDFSSARCGDQLASCSMEEAKLALTELAAFHAAWWNNPRLDDFGWIARVESDGMRQGLHMMYQQAWPMFVERYKDQLPPEIMRIGKRFGDQFETLALDLADRPRTMTHTDFRLDNMFFGVEGPGSGFALIDWQLVQQSGGASDVTYFLAGNFPPEVRHQHQTELLRTYHEALQRCGVTDYDWDQCQEDYRRAALFLMLFVVPNQENFDIEAYNQRAQDLMNTIIERYTTAVVDLGAEEFLAD